MIDNRGNVTPIDNLYFRQLVSGEEEVPEGQTVVMGTEDQMRVMSRRIKAGARADDQRKARRKRQKAARRQSRRA